MLKLTRLACAALCVAAGIVACGGDKTGNADSTANKDLAMAGQGNAQPQLKDAPKGAAAAQPQSKDASKGAAPAEKAPAKPTGSIAAGTSMVVHPSARVCTNTNTVGEQITATLADPVSGTNGVTIPAGSKVTMTIAALKRSENMKDPITMTLDVNSVTVGGTTYPVNASVTHEDIERVRDEPTEKDVQKVVGGAVIGAVAGKIIGKSAKGAVVGGAAGAAAGAGVAAATANYQGCIAQGSNVTIKLNSSLAIR